MQSCAPGTSSEHRTCDRCPEGTFSGAAAAKCTLCPLGTESEADFASQRCIPCEAGQYGRFYRGYISYPKCFDCPENTESYTPGRRFCRKVNGPCPRGYIETSTGDCERCEVDERYDIATEHCVPCPSHEGSVGGLPLTCAPCADVIRAKVEKSHCVPWDELPRIPVVSQTCAPGTHIHDTQFARFCVPCRPGFYSSETNSAECLPCPSGKVSTDSGATQCESCPEGMVPDAYPDKCVNRETNCAIDEQLAIDHGDHPFCVSKECSVSEDGSYACPPCVPGSSGLYEFRECEPCPGSQVRDYDYSCGCRGPLAQNIGMMDGTCSECPAGSYGKSVAEGENECVQCPAGTYRVVATYERMLSSVCPRCTEHTPCEKCPAGFVTRNDGAMECEKCPPGTFTYGIGDTECLSFGAPSASAPFNHPLDLDVQRERESFPAWWEAFTSGVC
ncbi:Tyrosine-protein kinase ephrin type A/B receptor-like protein [Gracilaria domingensis]|nr:Tyrosine-protein kinase ephrin type A/B receptor-like protein [Gracilaria domingensis]